MNGAAINTPQIIIMVTLGLLSMICIAVMIYAIRQTRDRFGPAERVQYLMIAGAILGVGITMIDTRIEPYIAPLGRALISEPPQPVIVNLSDCPEDTQGMTGQIIMTIETRSDLAPLVTGCTRIAERSFVVDQVAPQ